MKRTSSCLLLSGLALGVCMTAQAAEPQTPATAVTYSGVKVGIDAKTGKLRPLTETESAQLDQVLTQGRQPTFAPGMAKTFSAPADEAAARATVRQHAHGGVSARLPESQMTTVSAHRDAAGQLHIEHNDDTGNVSQGGGLSHE